MKKIIFGILFGFTFVSFGSLAQEMSKILNYSSGWGSQTCDVTYSPEAIYPLNSLLVGEGEREVAAINFYCIKDGTTMVVDDSLCGEVELSELPLQVQKSPAGIKNFTTDINSIDLSISEGFDWDSLTPPQKLSKKETDGVVTCVQGFSLVDNKCQVNYLGPNQYYITYNGSGYDLLFNENRVDVRRGSSIVNIISSNKIILGNMANTTIFNYAYNGTTHKLYFSTSAQNIYSYNLSDDSATLLFNLNDVIKGIESISTNPYALTHVLVNGGIYSRSMLTSGGLNTYRLIGYDGVLKKTITTNMINNIPLKIPGSNLIKLFNVLYDGEGNQILTIANTSSTAFAYDFPKSGFNKITKQLWSHNYIGFFHLNQNGSDYDMHYSRINNESGAFETQNLGKYERTSAESSYLFDQTSYELQLRTFWHIVRTSAGFPVLSSAIINRETGNVVPLLDPTRMVVHISDNGYAQYSLRGIRGGSGAAGEFNYYNFLSEPYLTHSLPESVHQLMNDNHRTMLYVSDSELLYRKGSQYSTPYASLLNLDTFEVTEVLTANYLPLYFGYLGIKQATRVAPGGYDYGVIDEDGNFVKFGFSSVNNLVPMRSL